MDIVPFRPLRMLSRWPDFWDDTDLNWASTRTNNLDLFETEEEVVVRANVAGVEDKDIDLTFEDGVLWIKAEKEEEKDEGKTHYSKSSWSYSYKIAIPGQIDFGQEPKAEVANGVLTVKFAKSEASKPRKLRVTAKK